MRTNPRRLEPSLYEFGYRKFEIGNLQSELSGRDAPTARKRPEGSQVFKKRNGPGRRDWLAASDSSQRMSIIAQT
jgi:hypothetical protein